MATRIASFAFGKQPSVHPAITVHHANSLGPFVKDHSFAASQSLGRLVAVGPFSVHLHLTRYRHLANH